MFIYFGGFLFFSFFLCASPQAIAAPPSLTYQGRILKSDGTPLEYNNVSFVFKIMDPFGQCLIYQEQVNAVDMTNSSGVFDIPIGLGAVSYPNSATFTVLDAFNNSSAFTCSGGSIYSPVSTDGRLLRVSFHDGVGWKNITPDNKIRSVPYAGYAFSAQKLGDKAASDFLTIAGLPTCGAGTFLTWNGTSLTCATAGATGGGTVTDVTSANSYLSVATGTSTPVLTVHVGNTAGTVAAGDDPRFASAIQTGAAAGGALTGTYPNPTLANNSVNTANINDAAITTAKLFSSTGINQLVATDPTTGTTLKALTCGVGQLLTWDAALGWKCTNQTSLAVGSSSLAANFTGSLSGDVTGTQSATIVSKIGGYSVDLSTAPISNQVLTWNGTSWVAASLPAGNVGTVTNVSSANGDISVASGASTPVLTLNSGTSANQIVKLDVSAKLPAVDGSQLTNFQASQIPNLDVAKITTGTLPVSRGGTGQSSYTDGQLLIGNTVGNTLTKATLTAGTGISVTNGNGSITIANTGLTGSSAFSGDVSGTSSTTSVDKIKGKAVSATAPTSGQFLVYDGATQYAPVSLSGDATMSNTGAVTLKNTGTPGTYTKVTTDAQGRVTSGTNLASSDVTTALGYTPLNKAGDVMTGTLGVFATASDPAGLVAGDKGKIWYNTTGNQLKYWDGSAAQSLGVSGSGLTSLNGQTGGTQTFATPGTSGTAPNWSSATNTHTLNIPVASAAGVTSGLISKTDYDAFNAKLGTSSAFSGDVSGTSSTTSVDKIKGKSIAPVAYVSGQFLRYDGTNWVNAVINAATDLSGIVPVANGGTGASSLGAGNLLIGAGTGAVTSLAAGSAGNVVYATGVASWSSGTPDTAGLVDKASTQTISGAKAFSNYIQMNAQNVLRFADADSSNYVALRSPATVTANVTWTLPGVDGTAGQILKTDGAGNLGWVSAGAGTGTVTNVSSANTDINVGTGTTTPVLTLNSGTAGGAADANKIAKLDAGGLLATNMIPNLDTAKITSGTLPVPRGGTGQSSYTDGQLLIGNTVGNTLTKATLTAGTGISVTNGNGSITIANTGLTGSSTFSGDISGTSTTTSVDKIKGKAVSATAPTSGQFLVYDGTTQYAPVSMSGDATISSAGALTIASNAISSAEISDGTIATADIADGAVTNAKMPNMAANTLKGNISGVAAAPADVTIASLQGSTSTTFAAGNDSRITGALQTSGGTMTGMLTLATGTMALSPLRIPSGALVTTPASGNIESDGASLYWTNSTPTRQKLASYTGTPTNGQLLIGNGTGFSLANLTQGAGITLTNSAGGITISATGSGGTVTNVTGTAPISVATGTSTPVISISQATTSTNGYLTSADWNTFNNKQNASLADAKIWVGQTGTPTAVTPGGDVSMTNAGIYTVTGIRGISISATAPSAAGQVLRYDGTSTYVPGFVELADVKSTITPFGGAFTNAGCSVGQTLYWQSSTDSFQCQNISVNDSQLSYTTSRTANTFLAAPNGTAGAATFRNIASADLPAGTLSGSGTPGAIPYYSAGSTLADSPISTSGGNVGVGTTPQTKLDVNGSVKVGDGGESCSGAYAGAVRYNSGTTQMEYCNGSSWTWGRVKSSSGTKTAAYTLVLGDSGNLIKYAGTANATFTFTPCSTLGDGWFVDIKNSSSYDLTLISSAPEAIDGRMSFIMYPYELRRVYCDGTEFSSVVKNAFRKEFTADGTFYLPPGYATISGILWGGGGGGGASGSSSFRAGGGGGGGSAPFSFSSSEFNTAGEKVFIGAGGLGATILGSNGQSGGNSYFMTTQYYDPICDCEYPTYARVAAGGGGGGGGVAADHRGGGSGGGGSAARLNYIDGQYYDSTPIIAGTVGSTADVTGGFINSGVGRFNGAGGNSLNGGGGGSSGSGIYGGTSQNGGAGGGGSGGFFGLSMTLGYRVIARGGNGGMGVSGTNGKAGLLIIWGNP